MCPSLLGEREKVGHSDGGDGVESDRMAGLAGCCGLEDSWLGSKSWFGSSLNSGMPVRLSVLAGGTGLMTL